MLKSIYTYSTLPLFTFADQERFHLMDSHSLGDS